MISFVKKNVAFKSVYNYVNICTEFKVCGKVQNSMVKPILFNNTNLYLVRNHSTFETY